MNARDAIEAEQIQHGQELTKGDGRRMDNVKVKIKRLTQTAQLPRYQTPGSAGMDLYADNEWTVLLYPGQSESFQTGIALSIPSGFEGQIRPRSGWAVKFGVTVANAPGTIDPDYRGEVNVLLINHGCEPINVSRGDRIAQLVIAPVVHAELVEVAELDSTERGAGGFGSTGKR